MKQPSDHLFEYLVPDMPKNAANSPDPDGPRDETPENYVKLVDQFAKVMAISDKYQADVADSARELRRSKEELERTQAILRENERRFRILSDNLPVGVAMIGARMEILAVNAKMKEWFPDAETEPYVARNRGWNPTSQGDVEGPCPVRNALNDGCTHSTEQEIQTRLGLRHLHITATPVNDADGRVSAVIEMVEDVTARKRAEAEMRASEARDRQHQKSESLGRMAGAIAHHFNNQLQSVMGNLELAMEDLPENNRCRERLNSAMLAARKAAEMSALMRSYLGQESVVLEPVDFSTVCREHRAVLTQALPKGFTLHEELPESGPIINGKTGQIAQILTSLTTNAWEAMDDEAEGVVGLKVETVPAAAVPSSHCFPIGWQPDSANYCRLEVTDTGKGIAPADIDMIFDPFFSNKFTGRGLGLSVVLGMVRAHNGAIAVESVPGKGSTFRCFFPVAAEKSTGAPAPASTRSAKTGGTVLVVEDEKGVRTMSAQMLKRMGFDVLEAEDGAEAVKIFRERYGMIACVLCDMSMPHMNGWETLAALRGIAPGIPVVLSSGYDEGYVMSGEHTELPQAFVSKPYDLEHLRNAIARALASAED